MDGDRIEATYAQDRVQNQYYPLIEFPSGIQRECAIHPETNDLLIHLSGSLYVPYVGNAYSAKQTLSQLLEEQNYQLILSVPHESVLTAVHPISRRGYRLQYHPEQHCLENINVAPRHTMDLLDGETRAILPPLYTNEDKGFDAQALVKFFTPDSDWTWYASEFDGVDLFFGLVSGLEVELGYFSLSELESITGPFGLPIERDLFYQPMTIAELRKLHRS